MIDGLRQDRATRRMGPLLLPLGAIHHRPGCVGGVQSISLGTNYLGNGVPLFAKQLDTLSFASAPLTPGAVDSKTATSSTQIAGTSRYPVARRGPACWSCPMLATAAGTCQTPVTVTQRHQPRTVGAMLSSKNGGVDPNSLTANNFRPLVGFSDVDLATNNLYANYNALQVTWVRSKGRYNINLNYTFGKAMGIINNAQADAFNLASTMGCSRATARTSSTPLTRSSWGARP